MDYTILGRTGLQVSRMGLGCGGPSRLGIAKGNGVENAVAVVRRALDLGVNFIDTAEAYGTESAVGQALAESGRRDSVVISTKASPRRDKELCDGASLRERVEASLTRLQTDRIDVFHLHGVSLADYEPACAKLLPTLHALRDEGKIRFLGITEAFGGDTDHKMLRHALEKDDHWDVIMVGFNLINQSARATVLPLTRAKNVGVLDMFAVRRALSNPDTLKALMADLAAKSLLPPDAFEADAPLGFLTDGESPGASSIPDAAYRFCRDEPGIHVVLSGTGSVAHLAENADSLSAPPLPDAATARLSALFAGIDSVSGN